MRRDRRALAGIFDALIFLAIASLVSVSMLSALGGPSPTEDDRYKRVDAAHTVLLRSTVIDARGNQATIEEVFKLDQVERAGYENNITAILDLLLPGTEWRWSVVNGGRSWAYGNVVVPEGEVYCSIVRAPFNGSEVEYRLDAWAP